ncbi:MAG: 5-oxoprolinase subunit PxpB [Luteitalea sp.]|nr:5-oxoprolinase subunit PxpB [Luteitalea sp.]
MTSPALPARFSRAGDSAIVVEFEERIDLAINARCIAFANAVLSCGLPGIRDVVPAYCTVTVYFDPLRTEQERLLACLKQAASETRRTVDAPGRTHRVPVCYGGELGPDLADVARFARLSEEETIERHVVRRYRVFMLGFIPGFAYLGTVDEQIAAPRRAAPRTRVPAGSVGIAAGQTGVYPIETPGGWQLIGRTPLRVFDPSRPRPSLFQPGDAVHFVPISRQQWDRFTL